MRRPYNGLRSSFKVNFGNILFLSSQANWEQEDPTQPDFIKNKPILQAGENIIITKEGNVITISSAPTVDPDTPDIPVEPDNPDENETLVDFIKNNKIPAFSGYSGEIYELEYKTLNGTTYNEEGFYIGYKNGTEKTAGYQFVFNPNEANTSQIFMLLSDVEIVTAYQFQPALNQWLEMGFDGTYWIKTETVTQEINGQVLNYTTYEYNSELMGDPIISTEYWRFEMRIE